MIAAKFLIYACAGVLVPFNAVFSQKPSLDVARKGLLGTSSCDAALIENLRSLIFAAEIDERGDVFLSYPMADQRFLSPGSGRYWQINSNNRQMFGSRSLENHKISGSKKVSLNRIICYVSKQNWGNRLYIVETLKKIKGSDRAWNFKVAYSLKG